MAKFGMTLSNRGVVTGATTVPEMLDLAGMADADPRWDSVWVGDSLLAKPRLDALIGLTHSGLWRAKSDSESQPPRD